MLDVQVAIQPIKLAKNLKNGQSANPPAVDDK